MRNQEKYMNNCKWFTSVLLCLISAFLSVFANAQNTADFWEEKMADLSEKEMNPFMHRVLKNKKESDSLKGDFLFETLAVFESKVQNDSPKELELLIYLGKDWIYQAQWERAYKLLYRAKSKLDKGKLIPQDEVQLYYSLGDCAFYYRQFDNAKSYMTRVISNPLASDFQMMMAYNVLGLCDRNIENYSGALSYFKKAFQEADKMNDEVWKGILSGNMGYVYLKMNDLENAEKYFRQDLKTSLKFHENLSALLSLTSLTEISRKLGKRKVLEGMVKGMDSLFTEMNQELGPKEYYKEKMNYYEFINDPIEALKNANLLYRVLEKEQKTKSQEEIEKTKFRIDFEKNQAKIAEVEQKRKFERQIYLGLSLLLLVVALAVLNSFRQRSIRRAEEKKVLELENEKIRSDFDNSQEKLKAVLNSLIQKNHLLVELNKELQNNKNLQSGNEKSPVILENWLSEFNLATEESWHEFKRLFNQLNPNFFLYLDDHYPDITIGERRHLALIQLRLEKDEIANALGISPESVRKANLRLRKKLGVETKEELQMIIKKAES